MKKRLSRTIALALVAGGITTAASAQTLSTVYVAGNGGAAGGIVFFDIVVGPSPITITSVDVNTAATVGTYGFTMYTHTGTYLGTEQTAAAWSTATTGTVAATGTINTPSPATFGTAVVLAANTTYGVGLVLASTGQTSAAHSYTNGNGANQTYSNADLTLNLGAAQNTPFTGTPFSPRVWNGTVHYTLGGTLGACCLPAPSYLCIQTTSGSCATQGGTYAGDNVTCAAANCPPPPTGACCNPATGCSITTQLACTNAGGTYAGDNVTCAAANCPPISVWQESGDAGDLPGTAQVTGGSGSMTQIRGTLSASDVDMYQINICDAANWSATSVGGTTIDTQFWLFKADGTGVSCDDDSTGLQSTLSSGPVAPLGNGLYYFAVSVFNRDAAGATSGGLIWNSNAQDAIPDGPAAAEPVGSWLNATTASGPYTVFLTGSCFVGGSFGACCLPNFTCSIMSPAACASASGTYAGDNVTCAAANCPPPPTGACCAPDGSCSVLTQAACNTAGGVYGGNNVTCANAGCVNRIFAEVGDAGDLPATAQTVTGGSGNVVRITGALGASDTDMYQINVCDRTTFTASTVGNGNTLDTQLWLFDNAGLGLAMDDDTAGGVGGSLVTGQFVPANGNVYIALTGYNRDAVDATAQFLFTNTNPTTGGFYPEWQPTGPGAANPVAGWQDVTTPVTGNYTIALTGACFINACYANCDGSTSTPLLTANDFQCFLNKYAAGDPYANCDGSTANPILTANDFQCFLNAYAVGCT